MGEQQKKEVPERIEDFLDHYDHIWVHQMGYNRRTSPHPNPIHVSSLLKHGIASTHMVMNLERRIGKEVFEMPGFSGTDFATKDNSTEVFAHSFSRSNWRLLSEDKELLKSDATRERELPAIIFRKPGFHGRSIYRVQPRFILGVILPKMEDETEQRTWLRELKQHKQPIYSYKGELIWKPEVRE